MKWILLCCLLLCFLQNRAQVVKPSSFHASRLVAANDKKTRKYIIGRTLKIHYHTKGQIVKAKGRLMIDNDSSIELIPYGRKNITIINTDSITSISRWNRRGKILLVKLAGTGIVAGALGAAIIKPGSLKADLGINLLAIPLILYAVADAYYTVIAAPVVFISEWLSVRSEKKGYHFSIE